MATFYTGVDQQRYDAGEKFLPMNRFLANYTAPTTNVKEQVTTSYGIPNTNAFVNAGGGGGGGNYTTGYRPNYEYRKSLDYNPELSDLQNQKIMQNMENYKGYNYYNEPEPTGLAKGIDTVLNYVPFIGPMKRGAEFLGDTLGRFMPVNQRAIMENELRGSGVFTDNLGRIVATPGQYNTPEGIMAGYNAAMMDDETFDKRTDRISKTLMDPDRYGLTQEQIEGIISGELTEEDFQDAIMPGTNKVTNLISNLRNIELAKLNFQKTKQEAENIYEWEKKQKEIEKQKSDPNILSPNNPLIGNIDHTGGGGDVHSAVTRAPGSKVEGAPTHSTRDDLMATGGRVGLRYGGLLSILGREGFKTGGRQDRMGGTMEQTAQELRDAAPDQFGGGMTIGHGGGDNQNNNNTVTVPKKLTISPVIESKWSDLGFTYPTGVFGFDTSTPLGKLKATMNLKNYVKGDDVDPTLNYQGNIGPVNLNATYSDDIQNINASINKNNWNAGVNYDAITGEPTFGFNYSKTFKHGGLAGLL